MISKYHVEILNFQVLEEDMEYLICNVADEDIFFKQCEAIENHIGNLIKNELLEDVDGSKIQRYVYEENEIKVFNDIFCNEVRIECTEDIEKYFSEK